MATWWQWDATRKVNGADWNNAREAVLDASVGHDHDGTNSKGVPKKVDSLPTPTPDMYYTVVALTTDNHVYVCLPP